MASRVVGIDIGAYSVKVAVAVPGFRSANITEYVERPVPAGDESALVRATRVLGGIISEFGLEQDSHYVAVAGDQVFIHILEFPFKSLRRSDLSAAVGAELESILPIDLDEMVYAFEEIPAMAPAAEPGADPGFVGGQTHGMVAPPTEGMRVLACAMPSDRAGQLLDQLVDAGVDTRGLVAAPESYPRLVAKTSIAQGEGPFAVIDIGHRRTDVCVVLGTRTVYARTIARGGKDLTDAIARNWQLPVEEAENAKHQDGFVGLTAQPPPTEAWQKIHDALIPELGPLSRDLRQTLFACQAKTGATVSRAVLVGGGARLNGLPEFLSERLGIVVRRLDPADAEAMIGPSWAPSADVGALAVGVALEGATGRPVFDLRQGALAYKADLSILRVKAVPLAIICFTILGFATLSGFMKLRALRADEKVLTERIAVESTAVFGKQMTAEQILAKVLPGAAGSSPLPKQTAYDLLLSVNNALPEKKKVTIDVGDVTIKAGKITLDFTSRKTGALQATDGITEVENGLKKVACFDSLTRGDTTTEKEDAKRVTLTIAVKESCR